MMPGSLDQTSDEQIKNLADALTTRNYRLDLLVLNAGVAEDEHPHQEASGIERSVHMWSVRC